MIVTLWPLTVTSISTAAVITTLFMLFSGHFQAFLAPEPVNPFEVYNPIFFSQLNGDPAIAVSWMLDMQRQQVFDYRLILVRQLRFIPLCAS